MKTRNGLISNSSTSSFIIVYKPKDKCSHCGRSDPDLKQMIEHQEMYNGDEYNINSTGVDDTIVQVKKDMESYPESNEFKEVIERLKNVPKDSEVIYFQMSNHDKIINNLIANIVSSKSGEIIYQSGC